MSGLTVDRPSMVRIKSGNGKSSITASVALPGGPGATIGLRLNSAIGLPENPIVRFPIHLMTGSNIFYIKEYLSIGIPPLNLGMRF